MKVMSKCLKIERQAILDDLSLTRARWGNRKLIVTEIYEKSEEEVSGDTWPVPLPGDRAGVYRMDNAEMSLFNEKAKQDRHYHKIGTEIYMPIEGIVYIEVEGKEYRLLEGDTLIVFPFSVHQVINRENRFLCRVITLNCGGKMDKYRL